MDAGSARLREIVATARELLERDGADGLSMRRIADRLGIRAPSLYKHVAGKQELENALISSGFEELAARFGQVRAGSPGEQLRGLGRAYRAFAHDHPHLYRLMTERPLDRPGLRPGVEDAAGAPIVAAVGGDADLARAAFAFAHGMTILELNHRFPPGADVDAAWERGMLALTGAASGT